MLEIGRLKQSLELIQIIYKKIEYQELDQLMAEGKRFLHSQDKPVLVLRNLKRKRKLEPSTTLSWDLMEEFSRGNLSNNNNLGGHSHRLHSPSASPTSRDQHLQPVDLLLRFSRTDSSLPPTPSRPASSSHQDSNLPDSSHQDSSLLDSNLPDSNLLDSSLLDSNLPDSSLPDSSLLDSNLLPGSQVNLLHQLFSIRSGIPSTLIITVEGDNNNNNNQVAAVQQPSQYRISLQIALVLP